MLIRKDQHDSYKTHKKPHRITRRRIPAATFTTGAELAVDGDASQL
jgi:hypothetical protein